MMEDLQNWFVEDFDWQLAYKRACEIIEQEDTYAIDDYEFAFFESFNDCFENSCQNL